MSLTAFVTPTTEQIKAKKINKILDEIGYFGNTSSRLDDTLDQGCGSGSGGSGHILMEAEA